MITATPLYWKKKEIKIHHDIIILSNALQYCHFIPRKNMNHPKQLKFHIEVKISNCIPGVRMHHEQYDAAVRST